MIALVKADKFSVNKFETALPVFSGHLFSYLGPLSLCAQKRFCLLRTSSIYNITFFISSMDTMKTTVPFVAMPPLSELVDRGRFYYDNK